MYIRPVLSCIVSESLREIEREREGMLICDCYVIVIWCLGSIYSEYFDVCN